MRSYEQGFSALEIDDAQLLPPSVQDYVPADHVSRLVVALVREEVAAAADAEEDKLYGDKRGDEMPDWVADKQKRLAKIRAAKAELEAEAKAAAEEQVQRRAAAEEKRQAEGGSGDR